jgi:hypothetical protein
MMPTTDATKSVLSTGAIIGIAIGGALLVSLIAGLGWFYHRHVNKGRANFTKIYATVTVQADAGVSHSPG